MCVVVVGGEGGGGCVPVYWKSIMPTEEGGICSHSPQLWEINRLTSNIEHTLKNLYLPPCQEMAIVTGNRLVNAYIGDSQLEIKIHYKTHTFQEITNCFDGK